MVVGGRHLVSCKAVSLRGGRSQRGAWAWRVCAVRISHPAVASTGDNGCPERVWRGATHQTTVRPRSGADPAGACPPGLVLLDTSSRGARTAARECARESLKRRLQKSSGDAWRWTSPGARAHRGDRRLAKAKAGAKSIVIVGLASPRGVFEPGVKAPRGPRRWKTSRDRESRRHITGVAVAPVLGRASRQGSQSPDHWSGDETSEARSSGRRAEENAALRVGERRNTARRKINPDGPPKRVGQP